MVEHATLALHSPIEGIWSEVTVNALTFAFRQVYNSSTVTNVVRACTVPLQCFKFRADRGLQQPSWSEFRFVEYTLHKANKGRLSH